MKDKKHHKAAAKLQPMQALLLALSEDLALPLLQVKTGLELIENRNFSKPVVRSQTEKMLLVTDNGLGLIEAYRYALKAAAEPDPPAQPVSIGAIFEVVAHQIAPYAKKYNTTIEIDIRGRPAPVLAHEPSLKIAMEVLGTSIIRAQSASNQAKKYQMLLGAHRNGSQVSAGVFSSLSGLSDKALRLARDLTGTARNPIPQVPPGAASGILIADMLCTAMWQPLRASAHNNLHGLSTALPLSRQLNLV